MGVSPGGGSGQWAIRRLLPALVPLSQQGGGGLGLGGGGGGVGGQLEGAGGLQTPKYMARNGRLIALIT